MKAQISFVEYLVAFVIFVTFITYIFYQTLGFMPNYLQEMRSEILRSEAYQISEILVNDAGEPANWRDPSSARRIGLSDESSNETNYLSMEKINILRAQCPVGGYSEQLKNLLGAKDDYQFSVLLLDKTDSPIESIDCHPQETKTRKTRVAIERDVAFSSRYGKLIVQVW